MDSNRPRLTITKINADLALDVAVRVYCVNSMIHPYDNATQTRWDRGDFKVQLNLPNNPRPIGFCDGSPEDVAELLSIAEAEGADDVKIHKKHLKSGREVWTLGETGGLGADFLLR